MKIKGKSVITNGIKMPDDDVVHCPCQDAEGNLYLPMLISVNNLIKIYYIKIPKTDKLPVVEIED